MQVFDLISMQIVFAGTVAQCHAYMLNAQATEGRDSSEFWTVSDRCTAAEVVASVLPYRFYAFGQEVPASVIASFIADGMKPEELTTEFLETAFEYERRDDAADWWETSH